MTHHTFSSLAAFGLSALLLGCTTASSNSSNTASTTVAASSAANTAASTAVQGEWRSLIDPTMSAWRGYREAAMPAGWTVANGVLSKVKSTNDIVTRDQFENFDLEWEWKIHEGGNAGVFYRGTEEFEKIYFTAPEYQLLDDANAPDGKSRLTSAAANYALYPAPAGVVKPADQWNTSRIVARGARVEHWLNGQKVVEYETGSPDWEAKVKASKFATWPKYGRITKGHVGIQGDHAGELAIRNMRIRVVP
ncbi:MAG TPA: DUF1080 domain-containing protein [Gemmatimonadaceae bacterium]|nr:DUF1080 domain-containing protein [Gemmatimonadaceae bacterium]